MLQERYIKIIRIKFHLSRETPHNRKYSYHVTRTHFLSILCAAPQFLCSGYWNVSALLSHSWIFSQFVLFFGVIQLTKQISYYQVQFIKAVILINWTIILFLFFFRVRGQQVNLKLFRAKSPITQLLAATSRMRIQFKRGNRKAALNFRCALCANAFTFRDTNRETVEQPRYEYTSGPQLHYLHFVPIECLCNRLRSVSMRASVIF